MTARDFDPDRASPVELRAELDRLQGEVDALRDALGLSEEGALRRAFGLPPFGARLLALLSSGRVLTKDQIYNGLYLGACDRESAPGKAVEVQVCLLRKRLDARFRIETLPGLGYRLAQGGHHVRAVIEAARLAMRPVPPALSASDRVMLELRDRTDGQGRVSVETGDLVRSARLFSPLADLLTRLARKGAVTILHRPADRGPAGVWHLRLCTEPSQVAA